VSGGAAIAVRVLAAANFSTYKHARSPFKPFALERTHTGLRATTLAQRGRATAMAITAVMAGYSR